jgi:hypothetical protein
MNISKETYKNYLDIIKNGTKAVQPDILKNFREWVSQTSTTIHTYNKDIMDGNAPDQDTFDNIKHLNTLGFCDHNGIIPQTTLDLLKNSPDAITAGEALLLQASQHYRQNPAANSQTQPNPGGPQTPNAQTPPSTGGPQTPNAQTPQSPGGPQTPNTQTPPILGSPQTPSNINITEFTLKPTNPEEAKRKQQIRQSSSLGDAKQAPDITTHTYRKVKTCRQAEHLYASISNSSDDQLTQLMNQAKDQFAGKLPAPTIKQRFAFASKILKYNTKTQGENFKNPLLESLKTRLRPAWNKSTLDAIECGLVATLDNQKARQKLKNKTTLQTRYANSIRQTDPSLDTCATYALACAQSPNDTGLQTKFRTYVSSISDETLQRQAQKTFNTTLFALKLQKDKKLREEFHDLAQNLTINENPKDIKRFQDLMDQNNANNFISTALYSSNCTPKEQKEYFQQLASLTESESPEKTARIIALHRKTESRESAETFESIILKIKSNQSTLQQYKEYDTQQTTKEKQEKEREKEKEKRQRDELLNKLQQSARTLQQEIQEGMNLTPPR